MRYYLPLNISFRFIRFSNGLINCSFFLLTLVQSFSIYGQVTCTKPGFAPGVTYPSGGNSLIATATADFNKDGILDLAVANNYSPSLGVLLGKGDGRFARVVTYTTGSSESCLWITTGDFNRDYKVDLVIAIGGSEGVGILLGKGDGSFAPVVTYPIKDIPYTVATGDFNKDGRLDLVSAGDAIGVLLGKGNGSFAPVVTYSAGDSRAYSVAVGDLNNDGKDDLAVANYYGEGVGVLMGKGDGSFSQEVTYPISGDYFTSIALGDFNRDGNRDMALANFGSGKISVLLGKGGGRFAAATSYQSGTDFSFAVTVGDFNGDGKEDLATANYNNQDLGSVGVLLGKGDGSFQPGVTFPSGGDRPYAVTTGDFNRDGRLDVAVSNTNNGYEGTVGVLLNTCGVVLKTYYRDKDGDGFGDPKKPIKAASRPKGYVSNKLDCNDAKVMYEDRDKDGYGSSVKVPCGGVANNYDSNDRDGKPRIYICHKGATRVINAHALKGHLRHGDYLGKCTSKCITQNAVEKVTVAPAAEEVVQHVAFSAVPNPATHITRIKYTIGVAARVSLKVYDVLGREVTTLFDGQRTAGLYSQEYNVSKLSPGVYYCRLVATANGKGVAQTLKLVKTD